MHTEYVINYFQNDHNFFSEESYNLQRIQHCVLACLAHKIFTTGCVHNKFYQI